MSNFEAKSHWKTAEQIADRHHDDLFNGGVTIIDPPKEVGIFTKSLQDKLLDQTKAWKQNDTIKKIEEQKQEDMKVLKKRWELMLEEEKRAAERQKSIEEVF